MMKQSVAVTAMNLRTLPQRFGTAWVIVVGIAVTVAVLVSVLAMAEGFEQAVGGTARSDRAIVLRTGSTAELNSTLSRENAQTIMDAPGVRKGPEGGALADAEAVVMVNLPQKASGTEANITLRGVGQTAAALRPEQHLIAGRMFRPALRELIVGKSAAAQFKGLDVGNHIAFRDSEWTIVGIFESGGDAHESELQGDIDTVLSAFRRNLFQSVTLQLESNAAFNRFKNALTTDPTLMVSVERETDYYAKQSEQLVALLNVLAFFVGGIMALGASFSALNAMYSAVSTRTREIATLRAIGFGGLPIIISVLAESLVLALIGSVVGSVVAWGLFNGNSVNTLGLNFSQVVFRLTVTPSLLLVGGFFACAIGLLGGIFPAIRAAKVPIATALRGT
jgi:putative ABC transport system permease protein